MSAAHRPTWTPAAGKLDTRGVSKQYSERDIAAHTRLKFRQPPQGGITASYGGLDVSGRRDLKAELERREQEAKNNKRRAEGLPEEPEPGTEKQAEEGDEERKRRKLLEETIKLDADDSEESDEEEKDARRRAKGKCKAVEENGDATQANGAAHEGSDDSSNSDDDDDDDEDDTAALLAELAKIKRERAEEAARQERDRAMAEEGAEVDRIARGNPLLDLETAVEGRSIGGGPVKMDFGVKRRWDDDVIFKNQAINENKPKPGFINDLTRTEFHKKFMQRYVK